MELINHERNKNSEEIYTSKRYYLSISELKMTYICKLICAIEIWSLKNQGQIKKNVIILINNILINKAMLKP